MNPCCAPSLDALKETRTVRLLIGSAQSRGWGGVAKRHAGVGPWPQSLAHQGARRSSQRRAPHYPEITASRTSWAPRTRTIEQHPSRHRTEAFGLSSLRQRLGPGCARDPRRPYLPQLGDAVEQRRVHCSLQGGVRGSLADRADLRGSLRSVFVGIRGRRLEGAARTGIPVARQGRRGLKRGPCSASAPGRSSNA